MGSQRLAVFAVLCGTLVLNGWVAAGLVGLGSRSIEKDGARIAADTPRATATAKDSVDGVFVQGIIDAAFQRCLSKSPKSRASSLLCLTLRRCCRPWR